MSGDCPEEQTIEHRRGPSKAPSESGYSTISHNDRPAADLSSLGTLGEYELLEILGRGGMGLVYLAKHRALGRLVALKTILHGSFSSPQDIARFRIEAEAAAQLEHPNIASIYEIGESQGIHYISMQYIDGISLDQWLRRTSPSAKACVAVVREIALAMVHAHQQGVVHRDLKPGNVMIDGDGSVRVVDFGLAKKLDSQSQMTITGQIVGTPSFMAPEQATGDSKNVTALADVYALGAILFFLLTGKPPFRGSTIYDTLDQVQKIPAPSLRSINRRISLDLSTICAKCLEKIPSQRYASSQALVDDLNRYLEHKPVLARRISTATRMWRWCCRNPLPSAFMLVTSGMLGATSYLYVQADRAVHDAQRSFHQQVLTINELLVQIGSSDLKNIPNSQSIRRDLLSKAERFYAETRLSGEKYQNIDDLHLQTTMQLAVVQGELAGSADDRAAALKKLRFVEESLSRLIEQESASPRITVADALAVYGLTEELERWWHTVKEAVDADLMVKCMRQSALSDCLMQQLPLLAADPETQVIVAQKALGLRTQVAQELPNDSEAAQRLAGAQHNLAEVYRVRIATTNSESDRRQSLAFLKSAQDTRRMIQQRQPSEKLTFEIAKGDYAVATSIFAAQQTSGGFDAQAISETTIEASLGNAISGFASLEKSPVYSLESRFSHAIALRTLALVQFAGPPTEEPDDPRPRPPLADCLRNIETSCEILESLADENPLAPKYAREWMTSLASLYEIEYLRLKNEQSAATEPTMDIDRLFRHLTRSRQYVIENAPAFLALYLAIAKQGCICLNEVNAQAEAYQVSFDIKNNFEKTGQTLNNAEVDSLLQWFDEALITLQPIQPSTSTE